jgi:hypothetical protein
MKKIKILLLSIVLPLTGMLNCKFVPLISSTPPLEQLKISTSEISNWRPEGDMEIYIGSELFSYNDGGAPQYLNKGLIQTGVQRISGPNQGIVSSMIMDFGTENNAIDMYNEKRIQNAGSTIPDPKYPISDVTVTSVLGGVTGFANYYNYYFEISVTGFIYPEDALKTLNQFLGLYFEKIESQ